MNTSLSKVNSLRITLSNTTSYSNTHLPIPIKIPAHIVRLTKIPANLGDVFLSYVLLATIPKQIKKISTYIVSRPSTIVIIVTSLNTYILPEKVLKMVLIFCRHQTAHVYTPSPLGIPFTSLRAYTTRCYLL
jgi:hypothetical protein